jgi:O-antigen ligase
MRSPQGWALAPRRRPWIGFCLSQEAARRHFVSGTGFASSPHLSRHPAAAELTPAERRGLDWGHPHNAFLQAWVELGLPGALLLSGLIIAVLRRLATLPAASQRVGLTVVMAITAIALVSHGAWQGWWISAVILAAALLTLSARNSKDAGEDPTESCSGLQQ